MKILKVSNNKIGIDLGLKVFAVCSNGKQYKEPEYIKKTVETITRLEQEVERKHEGSIRYKKHQKMLKRAYERLERQRNNFLQALSAEIIKENQVIVLEDLKVNDIHDSKYRNRGMSEASWSQFRDLLEYKSEKYGRELIIAPKDYASTQICSVCGHKYPKVKRYGLRQWNCPECHTHHDRDINASRNLLKLATPVIHPPIPLIQD